MPTRLRNFLAASRKPNMHAFGLFPPTDDLKWIENYVPAPSFLQSGVGILGTIDGINDTFTLTEYSDSVALFVDGILQVEGVDYTYTSGTGTIVFAGASIPTGGQLLTALVWGDFDSSTAYSTPPKIEIPAGARNGTNATFTVAGSPTTFMLYYNGQLLSEGVGYSRSTNVITMSLLNIPSSAVDLLVAVYW